MLGGRSLKGGLSNESLEEGVGMVSKLGNWVHGQRNAAE